MRLLLVLLILFGDSCLALRAEDWRTLDGKCYRGVKVVQVEPDAVTILDDDGGALVPLSNLPPVLQRRFDYDPARARIAAAARARQEAASRVALQQEAALAKKLQAAEKTSPASHAPAATANSIKESAPDPNHKSRDSLLQNDGLTSEGHDVNYPAGNADGKNTSGQSHLGLTP